MATETRDQPKQTPVLIQKIKEKLTSQISSLQLEIKKYESILQIYTAHIDLKGATAKQKSLPEKEPSESKGSIPLEEILKNPEYPIATLTLAELQAHKEQLQPKIQDISEEKRVLENSLKNIKLVFDILKEFNCYSHEKAVLKIKEDVKGEMDREFNQGNGIINEGHYRNRYEESYFVDLCYRVSLFRNHFNQVQTAFKEEKLSPIEINKLNAKIVEIIFIFPI